MLQDVITPAENIVVLHLDMNESGMQFRLISAKPKNWFMRAVTFFTNAIRHLVDWARPKAL